MTRARVADIITLASEIAGIERKVLVGPIRRARIVRVRQACMLLGRENGHSFPTIGRVFGRDHSTVVHGCQVAEAYIARDPAYAAFVDRLRATASEARPYVAERLTAPLLTKPKPAAKPKRKPRPAPVDLEIRHQVRDEAGMHAGSKALAQAVSAALRSRQPTMAAG